MANMTEFDTACCTILEQHSNVQTERLYVPDYINMVREHFEVNGIFKGSATQHVIRFEADFSDNTSHAVKMFFRKYPVDDVAVVLHRSSNIGPQKNMYRVSRTGMSLKVRLLVRTLTMTAIQVKVMLGSTIISCMMTGTVFNI